MYRLDCYPNVLIIYRILFIVPVMVARVKRNFLKLKLFRNYLRLITAQERLNGLAILCIEKLMDVIYLNGIIDDFASQNVGIYF
jgi:hypothetical protein